MDTTTTSLTEHHHRESYQLSRRHQPKDTFMIGNSAPGINTGSDYTAPGGVGFAPQSRNLDAERAAWGASDTLPSLAAQVKRLYVSRFDRFGGYKGERIGDDPATVSTVTLPEKGPKAGSLSDWLIRSHFTDGGSYRQITTECRASGFKIRRGISATIGAHVISPAGMCKFIRIDLDAHGKGVTPENAAAVAANNLAAARAWLARLRSLGFRSATLFDSDGRGGLWLDVYFAEPIPSALAYVFAGWLIHDWRNYGLTAEPEAFPKQHELGDLKYGNWVRLPGHHHKRPHLSRILTDDGRLLAGADAVAHLLSIEGDDPGLLPATVYEQTDRMVNPPPAPEPAPRGERRQRTADDASGDLDYRIRGAENYADGIVPKSEGDGRNNAAFALAAECFHGKNLPDGITRRIVTDWNSRNSLPLDDAELDSVIGNAAKYGGRKAQRVEWTANKPPPREYDFSAAGLSGPPLIPYNPPSWLPSGFVVSEEVDDNRGRRDPKAERAATVARIIGPSPAYQPCPYAVVRLMEGVSRNTVGTDLLVKVRCRRWCGCSSCRERRRWAEKQRNVPVVIARGTHVWEGQESEWEAVRKKLDRARVARSTYGVIQDGGRLAVFLAVESDPATLPTINGLRECRGEAAGETAAAAINAVPDNLTPPPGRVKVKPFRPSQNWVAKNEDENEDEPDVEAGTGDGDGSGNGEQPENGNALAEGDVFDLEKDFRAVKTRVVVSIDRAAEILRKYKVRYTRGHLADAELAGDGGIEDSLAWDAGDNRGEIRRLILGRAELEWPDDRLYQSDDDPIPD